MERMFSQELCKQHHQEEFSSMGRRHRKTLTNRTFQTWPFRFGLVSPLGMGSDNFFQRPNCPKKSIDASKHRVLCGGTIRKRWTKMTMLSETHVFVRLVVVLLCALLLSIAWSAFEHSNDWALYYFVRLFFIGWVFGFIVFHILTQHAIKMGWLLEERTDLTKRQQVMRVCVWKCFAVLYGALGSLLLFLIDPYQHSQWSLAGSLSLGHMLSCAVVFAGWRVAGHKDIPVGAFAFACLGLVVSIFLFAFAMTFGYYWAQTTIVGQVGMCLAYPLGVVVIKGAAMKFLGYQHNEFHFFVLFLAAVPYRMLFAMGLQWGLVFALAAVEIVYKVVAYPLMLTEGSISRVVRLKRLLLPRSSKTPPDNRKLQQQTVLPEPQTDVEQQQEEQAKQEQPAPQAPKQQPREEEEKDLELKAKLDVVHLVAMKFFVQAVADSAAIVALVAIVLVHSIGGDTSARETLLAQYAVLLCVEIAIIMAVPLAKHFRKHSAVAQAFDPQHQGKLMLEKSNLAVVGASMAFTFMASIYFLLPTDMVPP